MNERKYDLSMAAPTSNTKKGWSSIHFRLNMPLKLSREEPMYVSS